MIALLLVLLAPAAAAPLHTVTFTVGPTSGPPDDPCPGQVTSLAPTTAPAVKEPAASPAAVPPASPLLHFDLAPGAANAALAAEDAARLQWPGPYDLARVPVEPVRGRPEDLARVRAVWEEARRGARTVRIAFWGASHVAGEYWTGELRRMLQTEAGDAGHGFVMPAAPWKGYRATDVNLCTVGAWVSDFDRRVGGRDDGRYGPAGVSVESSDAQALGWVQTTRTNPQGRAVSRFEVMYLRQPGGGAMDLQVDDAAPLRVPTAGDGPGLVLVNVPDGPHRLTVRPVGDGPVRLFGVNLERDVPGVVVDAMGVSGRTAASWQRWDLAVAGPYLERRRPDLAVLAYGTNEANDPNLDEARYRRSLAETLTRFRAVLPDTPCLLVGPSDRGKKVSGTLHHAWPHTAWVARVQREVGPEHGCATWDLQAATGGLGSVFRWRQYEPVLMAPDLIHFTAEGYKEVARRLWAAMTAPAP